MAVKLKINGGKYLRGTINITGAKNSVVAIIPAALLCKSVVVLDNVPNISDVKDLLTILSYIGCKTTFINNRLTIDATNVTNKRLNIKEISKFRASYYFMGVFLALFKSIEINAPGGCVIGNRPINLHLEAFRKMNVEVLEKEEIYILTTSNLTGAIIELPFPSVGATINAMFAGTGARERTIIKNAAREPEIVDIANFLNAMGCKVIGAGSDTIVIEQQANLHGCEYKVIFDRIEAGTYMMIAAAVGDEIIINNVDNNVCKSMIETLSLASVTIIKNDNSMTIKRSDDIRGIKVVTSPYPNFPTDLQQPLSALLTKANGQSTITESIYDNRLAHIAELNKMGASISIEENKIIIPGRKKLVSNHNLVATDLRAGAAMILASLMADGESTVINPHYIERGYDNFIEKLRSVGASIIKVTE